MSFYYLADRPSSSAGLMGYGNVAHPISIVAVLLLRRLATDETRRYDTRFLSERRLIVISVGGAKPTGGPVDETRVRRTVRCVIDLCSSSILTV